MNINSSTEHKESVKFSPGFLVKSPNLFVAPIDQHYVIFNPDAQGIPLLVIEPLVRLLSIFDDPVRLSEESLTTLANHIGFRKHDTCTVLNFLQQSDFLHNSMLPLKRKIEQPLSWETPRHLSVWLHITNQCNLCCPYCYISKSIEKMSPEIILEVTRKLVNTVQKYNIVKLSIRFTGGEPSLARDNMNLFMKTISKYALDSVKVRYSVLTNGTLLTRSFVKFLDENSIGVGLSLEGVGATHDKTRRFASGSGSFLQIENGVERLLSAGIKPHIMSTLSESGIEDLPSLTRWIIERRLFTRFSFVRECIADDFSLYNKKIIDAVKKALHIASELEFGSEFLQHLSINELSFRYPITDQPCEISKVHIVVNHVGQICLCPMTLNEPLNYDGDDLLTPLQQNYPRYTKDPIDSSCLDCRWLSVCGTGCPVINEQKYGHPNAKSPFCEAYKAIIPEWILTYGRTLEDHAKDYYAERPESWVVAGMSP